MYLDQGVVVLYFLISIIILFSLVTLNILHKKRLQQAFDKNLKLEEQLVKANWTQGKFSEGSTINPEIGKKVIKLDKSVRKTKFLKAL